MLKWPERAKAAIRKLFQPLQDIEIYVEDEDDEVFYRSLLKRIAPANLRIARILGLGGRHAVINAANSHADPDPALFLIDGDLDWVRGAPSPSPRVHRHEAYCVENLILCEHAAAYIISQELAVSEEEAQRRLDFHTWQQNCVPLLDLFAAYATAHALAPAFRTVSTGIGVMCTASRRGKSPVLTRAKVALAAAEALHAAEVAGGRLRTRALYKATHSRVRGLPRQLDAVSGKDFLLPLLDFHLQAIGCRISRRALRMRLAAMCDEARLAGLKAAMEQTRAGKR